MTPWMALARADRVNVLRAPLLLVASFVALPLGLMVRATRPALTSLVGGDVDALLGSFVLVLPALLAGTVQGYLVLEERDAGVEEALRVSPVGLDGLWRWRLGASFGLGLVTSAVAWGLAGLPVGPTLPLALLVAGLHGPAIALVLARARDKVQGLALSKLTSLAAVAQITWLLPGEARLVGAPFPAWWLAHGLGDGGGVAMTIAAGLAGLTCATLVVGRPR